MHVSSFIATSPKRCKFWGTQREEKGVLRDPFTQKDNRQCPRIDAGITATGYAVGEGTTRTKNTERAKVGQRN